MKCYKHNDFYKVCNMLEKRNINHYIVALFDLDMRQLCNDIELLIFNGN